MLLEIAFAMTPRERRTVVIYVSYLEQISSFTMCITKVPVSYTAKQWFQFSWLGYMWCAHVGAWSCC